MEQDSTAVHMGDRKCMFCLVEIDDALLMFTNQVVSQTLRKHGWPDCLDRDGYLEELERVRPEG